MREEKKPDNTATGNPTDQPAQRGASLFAVFLPLSLVLLSLPMLPGVVRGGAGAAAGGAGSSSSVYSCFPALARPTRQNRLRTPPPQRSAQGREVALIAAVGASPPPARAAPAATGVPPAAAALVVLAVLVGHRLLLHGAHRVHVVLVGLVLLLGLLRLRLRLLLVRLLLDGHDVRLLRVLRLLLMLRLLGELRLLNAVAHGHALHCWVLLEVTAQAEFNSDRGVVHIRQNCQGLWPGRTWCI